MIYILSCVIHKFFLPAGFLSVHQHPYLALFRADHHRLITHPAHHVKWVPGFSPQRQFQCVFLDPFFKGIFQGVLDLEKTICRAQPAYALVGTLIIVIFYPQGTAL
jgi:hypothetical protein